MNTQTQLHTEIRAAERRADRARDALERDVAGIVHRAESIRPIAVGGAIGLGAMLLGGRALVGAASGIVAGLAMTQAHTLMSKLSRSGSSSSGGDPATVKAAEAAVGPLPEEEKERAGEIAHHAMAGITGAVYGMTKGIVPFVSLGRGLFYGAAVWLVADELVVPALGLSGPPWKSPMKTHVRGLVAHLVYGAALDACMRLARPVLR